MDILTIKNKFKIVKTLAITLAMCATVIFTACNSSSENLENANEDVYEANEDLNTAEQKYAIEVEQLRAKADRKINENEKKISELNSKIKNSGNELKVENEKQIIILEQKNESLKTKMSEYNADSRENWSSFKAEVNKELDRLGAALEDFTVEN